MIAFATIDDLSAYMNKPIPADDATAELALSLASDAVRAYCRQDVSQATTTEVLEGTGSTLLMLAQTPVSSVGLVKVDGTTVESSAYAFTQFGALYRKVGTWPGVFSRIEVTYTHGWPEVPGPVKAATLSVAARIIDSPAGVRQETIGAYSVTYTNGVPALLETETLSLDPYRLG